MALTNRSNGVAGGLVSSDWWNDYYKLLRGQMLDQPIQSNNPLTLKAQALDPTAAAVPSVVPSAGNLGVGSYTYAYTYVNADGAESATSPTGSMTTTTGHQQGSIICASQVSPSPAVQTNIYRSKVGTTTPLYFVGSLNTNGGTFTDNVADTSLTNQPPSVTPYSGGLRVQDSSGNTNLQVLPNGNIITSKIIFPAGSLTRVSQIGGTGTGAAQTVNHNLGVTPDNVLIQYAGNFGSAPTHPPYWYNATSTQVTIVADNGYSWLALAYKL